jgi:hypothetical protein
MSKLNVLDQMAYSAFENHVNEHINMLQKSQGQAPSGNGQMMQNGPMGGVAPEMPSVGQAPNPMMEMPRG